MRTRCASLSLCILAACAGQETGSAAGMASSGFTCFPEACESIPGAQPGDTADADCGGDCSTPVPECPGGRCTSKCGDGITLGEACDDGNTLDGDGCSSDCTVEEGFTCEVGQSCTGEGCTLRVPVTYRDFRMHQPQDFEVGCGELATGVVEDTLDDDGKPVLKNGGPACIHSAETFAQWYRDGENSRTVQGVLTLYQNEQGAYVNRYAARGRAWVDPQGTVYDGNPLFFPLDDVPDVFDDPRFPAKIPEQYGFNGWPWERTLDPDAPEKLHNFSFTTEVVSWFLFDPTKSATLEFTGDDDVWVFINGKLAVDLGGCHVPESASVTLDRSTAARFGLDGGGLYPIHVFHAERKMEGSSFKLTLTGFDLQRSECSGNCGDGIQVAGEHCDDGNTRDDDGCPANCLVPVI